MINIGKAMLHMFVKNSVSNILTRDHELQSKSISAPIIVSFCIIFSPAGFFFCTIGRFILKFLITLYCVHI